LYIQKYYLNPDEHTPLCSVLHCDERNKKWLDGFGKCHEGWKNFIKTNQLDGYVVNDKVKDLFKNVLRDVQDEKDIVILEKPRETLIPKGEEIPKYFKNVNFLIEERGKKIWKKLTEEHTT